MAYYEWHNQFFQPHLLPSKHYTNVMDRGYSSIAHRSLHLLSGTESGYYLRTSLSKRGFASSFLLCSLLQF